MAKAEVYISIQWTYSKGNAPETVHRMDDGGDVHDHLREFFDMIDKLSEMEIDINADLLTVMLLYSLPPSYENFRCAIESRDELPTPENLRIKIIEEHNARKNDTREHVPNAMLVKRQSGKCPYTNKKSGNKSKASSKAENRSTYLSSTSATDAGRLATKRSTVMYRRRKQTKRRQRMT